MKLSLLSSWCSVKKWSAARKMRSAALCLATFFIACPLYAQCIVICYATNYSAAVTGWSGYWDFLMGYWTYSWTETYKWDCDPLNACTSSCAICERSTQDRSTDGTNWTQVTMLTGLGTSNECGAGITDVYSGTANLNPNTYYRFRWMTKAKLPTNTCDSGLYSLGDTKTFLTGPPG
jgi:hypothetical protein